MSLFLTNKQGNLYTCITATEIICSDATFNQAYEAVLFRFGFLSRPAIEGLLEAYCEPSKWRATFAAATANSLTELEASVAVLEDSSEVVELKDKLAELHAIITAECNKVQELHEKQDAEIKHNRSIEQNKQLLYKCEQERLRLKAEFIAANKNVTYDPQIGRAEQIMGTWFQVKSSSEHFDILFQFTALHKQIRRLTDSTGGL